MKQITRILLLFLFITGINAQAVDSRPNIIFIMLDDADIMDLDIYNAQTTINTPAISSFAGSNNSLTFFNYFTSGPNCAQTRASLLSGQHPTQLGLWRGIPPIGAVGIGNQFTGVFDLRLADELKNDELKNNGYKTASIGKWHNGLEYDFYEHGDDQSTNIIDYSPSQMGFDETVFWYANCEACGFDGDDKCNNPSTVSGMPDHYFSYNLFDENNDKQCHVAHDAGGNFTVGSMKNYLPNVITERAVDYITTNTNSTEPFFMNLWYYTPHGPGHEVPDCPDSNDNTLPCTFIGSTGSTDPKVQYRSMMEHIDKKINEVLAEVETITNRETIVIITSDNGGDKAFHDVRGEALGADPLDYIDANAKYRGNKNTLYERGIKAPLIVKTFNSSTNVPPAKNFDFFTSRDFFATILDVADVMLPTQVDGVSFKNVIYSGTIDQGLIDNYNLRPEFWDLTSAKTYRNDLSFCDGNNLISDPVNYQYTGEFMDWAVKQGDWKLIHQSQLSFDLPTTAVEFCADARIASTKLYKFNTGDCSGLNPAGCNLDDPNQNVRFEVDTGEPDSDEITNRPDVINYLTMLYDRWHAKIAPIKYTTSAYCSSDPTQSCQGILGASCKCDSTEPGVIDYLPEVKSIDSNSQTRIYSNSLSFTTTIKLLPDQNGQCHANGVIAHRYKGWTFKVKNGELQFAFDIQDGNRVPQNNKLVTVSSGGQPTIGCDVDHHVGFSVYGSKTGNFVTRIFVDGEEKQRSSIIDTTAIDISYPEHWKSYPGSKNFQEHDYKIVLGANVFANNVFRGTIDYPLISSIPFTNEEMLRYASESQNRYNYMSNRVAYRDKEFGGATQVTSNGFGLYQFDDPNADQVVILEESNVGSFAVNSNTEDFYFSTLFKLDAAAHQPQSDKVVSAIAFQKESEVVGSTRFNLKLVKNNNEDDALIKLFYRYKNPDPDPESVSDTCYVNINPADVRIKVGEEHFVAFQKEVDTVNSNINISLYLDGVLQGSETIDMNCSLEPLLASLPEISIGSKNVNAGTPGYTCLDAGSNLCNPFHGQIYKPMISNTVLDEDQIYWTSRASYILGKIGE